MTMPKAVWISRKTDLHEGHDFYNETYLNVTRGTSWKNGYHSYFLWSPCGRIDCVGYLYTKTLHGTDGGRAWRPRRRGHFSSNCPLFLGKIKTLTFNEDFNGEGLSNIKKSRTKATTGTFTLFETNYFCSGICLSVLVRCGLAKYFVLFTHVNDIYS